MNSNRRRGTMEKVTEKGIKFTKVKFKTIPWDGKANEELRSCKEE